MKVSSLLGERLKAVSEDITIESQLLMLKGGYIKNVGNGIFTLLPPAQRISKKIQNIIREEMDAIDGQEVLFPVVMPASIWQESGRFYSIGSEMVRFKDRTGSDMVLGMTHEEAATHLVRNIAKSYTQYPFMIYQIQTKFRDEARPRGGLIRVREFTMKDAYSFHTNNEDMLAYYDRAHKAYENIFRRAGAKNFISVKSDSGMMGGNVSHEFMLLTPVGEDTLAICSADDCGYTANMECAESIVSNPVGEEKPLQKVYTPDAKTIDAVCRYLHSDEKSSIKAVVYQKTEDDSYVIVFIRGDLDVNETKLRKVVKGDVYVAKEITDEGIVAGFIGPVGLKTDAKVIYDSSLMNANDFVAGANEKDYHYSGVNLTRDVGHVHFDDVAKIIDGGVCPKCGRKTIRLSNGIEIGNIFQLGTKYSKSMNLTYIDENNTPQYPIMGCYGIGVGRLMASICEESHDKFGPIWPISIAPWEIEICNLRADDEEVSKVADDLYARLSSKADVLYDDRDIRPGAMFADADLFGVPVRVVVSPKNLAESVVEVSTRDKSVKTTVALDSAVDEILALVEELKKPYAK